MGVHQAFDVEKICYISYAKDYGNYNYKFQYFSFCPHTHFVLTPPLLATLMMSLCCFRWCQCMWFFFKCVK